MKLIGGGVKKNDDQCAADARPRPRRQMVSGMIERAKDEQRQDGVFGQVAALAENMVKGLHLGFRHPGKSQRSRGINRREECSYECESADAPKMTAIQIKTGSQNFKKLRIKKFRISRFKFQEGKSPLWRTMKEHADIN